MYSATTNRPKPSAHRPIVVGIDGSPMSTLALRWAAAEAYRRDDRLDIVHAWDVSGGHVRAGKLLEAAGETISHTYPDLDIRTLAPKALPGPALVDLSSSADLMVLGPRGTGGIDSRFLGSVSQTCIENSHSTVVVIRQAFLPTQATSRRIVVAGVDGSKGSDAAVRWAAEEAGRRDASLRLVNAWTLPPFGGFGSLPPERTSEKLLHDARKTAASVDREIKVETKSLYGIAGSVLTEITEGAELLVMGARGASGYRGLSLGSKTAIAALRAPCPFVIVRPEPTRVAVRQAA